jgi:hypothetical protein
MNVVSWESGDTTITDLPACADPMLARLVQHVNDHYCTHRDGDLLCPPCSVDVLDLAHRTVGTGSTGLSDAALKRVWVRIACEQAREIMPSPVGRRGDAYAALLTAEAWLDGKASVYAANQAALTCRTSGTADWPSEAARFAAAAAGAVSKLHPAVADKAATSLDCANSAAGWADVRHHNSAARLRMAHKAVDRFAELTGHVEQSPEPAAVACAVDAMRALA